MSYDYHDAAMDEAYERLSEELYPSHKAKAIVEFTRERLRSYYLEHTDLLLPAGRTYKLAKTLLAANQPEAALVFAASAIELFLKACLLRPVVAGLVHSPSLTDLVVDAALSQTGFDRYENLLAGLFKELTRQDIRQIKREGATEGLLKEAAGIQSRRNRVAHRGETATMDEAAVACAVATAVFDSILATVLAELDLSMRTGGNILDVAVSGASATS